MKWTSNTDKHGINTIVTKTMKTNRRGAGNLSEILSTYH